MTLARSARFVLHLSRADFARLVGVSVRTVEAWEQRTREPTGAATTLLELLIADPATSQRALDALGLGPDRRSRVERIERAIRALAREWSELREAERGEQLEPTLLLTPTPPGRTP